MEQKQKEAVWQEYSRATHILGRIVSIITVVLLVGAPFAYALNYLTETERSLREDDAFEREQIAERERRRQEQWNAYFHS